MASDVLTNIEPFNAHESTENSGARWQKWLRRFNNFLIATGITDDTRMEAMILHCLGEETFDIYCSLPDPTTTPASTLTKYEKTKQSKKSTQTKEEHNKVLEKVLTRLSERNLTINKEKCISNTTKIIFFGNIFTKDGIHPDPKKINIIINLPKPKQIL
ncbi:hypothetical protein QE152_g39248 [Popillia japonica]|uniref:Uncharacterized protein n=1 Tax=Popillia japonica TaxID=7064 RepID=A0AAW1HUN2_POPJA